MFFSLEKGSLEKVFFYLISFTSSTFIGVRKSKDEAVKCRFFKCRIYRGVHKKFVCKRERGSEQFFMFDESRG